MSWTVILADGHEYSPVECDAQDVPRWPRTVCIAQSSTVWTHKVLVNGDWYCHRTDLDCWTEHTDAGLYLELIDHAHEIDAVRAGKYVDKPTFKALWARGREIVNG
jgi:hypothetical protein